MTRKETNSNGEEIKVEYEVKALSNTITKVNKDGTISEILIGDYVDYVSNTNTSMKWRVLEVEKGQLLLMSTSNVATLTLNGEDIYYKELVN